MLPRQAPKVFLAQRDIGIYLYFSKGMDPPVRG